MALAAGLLRVRGVRLVFQVHRVVVLLVPVLVMHVMAGRRRVDLAVCVGFTISHVPTNLSATASARPRA